MLWICICRKSIFHVFWGVHQKHMGDDWVMMSKASPCLWKMSLKVLHLPLHTRHDHSMYLEKCWESSLPLLINRYLQQSVKSEFLRSRHLIVKLILLPLGLWKGKKWQNIAQNMCSACGHGGIWLWLSKLQISFKCPFDIHIIEWHSHDKAF